MKTALFSVWLSGVLMAVPIIAMVLFWRALRRARRRIDRLKDVTRLMNQKWN